MIFSKDKIFFLDGAMGTMIQKKGLKTGRSPETLSITAPDAIEEIHRAYIQAGSDIIYTNTFGANPIKFHSDEYSLEETIRASVAVARRAAEGTDALVALDIGPTGQLLEPMGCLSFEKAYKCFKQVVDCGAAAGADLIVIETMTDLGEARAALLAAKENCSLPVMVSMSFEKSGKTFMGCSVESMALTLEGMGADAVGINCSLAPDDIYPIARRLCSVAKGPVFIKANAGLPNSVTGSYDMDPAAFASGMEPYTDLGISAMGGCCGTAPRFIAELKHSFGEICPRTRPINSVSALCTAGKYFPLDGVSLVGNRISAGQDEELQEALQDEDFDCITDLAAEQSDDGAEILRIDLAFPGGDENGSMSGVIKELQTICDLPLLLVSDDPETLETALRLENGKAMIKCGEESLCELLPLAGKYGAAIACRADGDTAKEMFDAAQRCLSLALDSGISKEDVYIYLACCGGRDDTLTALRMVKDLLGLHCLMDIPADDTELLTMAIQAGLSLPVTDPSDSMTDAAAKAEKVTD